MPEQKRNLKSVWFAVIALLVLTNVIVWAFWFSTSEKKFKISFYDVGQGDSALIQTKEGYNILVDGGPNNKVVDYLNRDLPVNDREIDAVILTHPQADHMYGLIETLKKYKVKKILTTNATNNTKLYQNWIDTINNKKIALEYVKTGETLTTGDGVTLKFVWPQTDQLQKVDDLNVACVVFKLSYGSLDVLMTGDADVQTQPYPEIESHIEVLKVPHHGSKTAIKDEELEKIKPEIAVISVAAKNRYGHPTAVTLNQLQSFGAKIFRTDQRGTVKIVSDGQRWYTQTER
ncbi:MAG TPA: MBL fold metallo-hydrolase [Candidatus Saccharimonadales bacterium]|nr:MBL fold metallo-hydrolase [Candidatus Saccharimonadales bacterium]